MLLSVLVKILAKIALELLQSISKEFLSNTESSMY